MANKKVRETKEICSDLGIWRDRWAYSDISHPIFITEESGKDKRGEGHPPPSPTIGSNNTHKKEKP